jgi:hypothetical protein
MIPLQRPCAFTIPCGQHKFLPRAVIQPFTEDREGCPATQKPCYRSHTFKDKVVVAEQKRISGILLPIHCHIHKIAELGCVKHRWDLTANLPLVVPPIHEYILETDVFNIRWVV